MKIYTSEQYRAALEEAQRLEKAPDGSAQHQRRQALVTAMEDYELDHLVDPNCRPGRPAGSV